MSPQRHHHWTASAGKLYSHTLTASEKFLAEVWCWPVHQLSPLMEYLSSKAWSRTWWCLLKAASPALSKDPIQGRWIMNRPVNEWVFERSQEIPMDRWSLHTGKASRNWHHEALRRGRWDVQAEGLLGREVGRAASRPAPAPRCGQGCKQRVDEGGLVSPAEGSPTRGTGQGQGEGPGVGEQGESGNRSFWDRNISMNELFAKRQNSLKGN